MGFHFSQQVQPGLLQRCALYSFCSAFWLCLSGCAHHNTVATQDTPLLPSISYDPPTSFAPKVGVLPEEELFKLTPEQERRFDRYLNKPWNKASPRYDLVFEYLEGSTQAFNFQAQTHVASETLEQLRGNCMSLAVLTTALARQAKVHIRYQLMDGAPIFYKDNNIIVKGVHVRSKLYDQPQSTRNKLFSNGGLVVDYLPDGEKRFVGNISHEKFLALFYANKAVEFMAEDKFEEAYWNAREALYYKPLDAASLNTMAVVFRRIGDNAKAEEIYQYGLAVADDKLTPLKNYRLLLDFLERDEDAEVIRQQMVAYDDPSPFGWLDAAHEAYDKRDYSEARLFYRKAIDVAPYLDDGYFGLAKIDYQLGHLSKAKSNLQKAIENTFRDKRRLLYEAKLDRINNEIKISDS